MAREQRTVRIDKEVHKALKHLALDLDINESDLATCLLRQAIAERRTTVRHDETQTKETRSIHR